MKKMHFLLLPILIVALATGTSRADQVTGLNTFTAGTTAVADEVNANFSEVKDSVDDNYSRINIVTSTANDNDTRISAVEDAYMGTLYMTLGAPAFVSLGDYNHYLSEYVIWLASGTSTTYYFYTDIQLPQGAQVNSFSVWVNDAAADAYVSVILARTGLNGTGFSTLASVSTSSVGVLGTQNLTDTSISNNIIDNSSYAYLVRVVFSRGDRGLNLQFFSAQIQYSLPVP
jgi:hypothetical protein